MARSKLFSELKLGEWFTFADVEYYDLKPVPRTTVFVKTDPVIAQADVRTDFGAVRVLPGTPVVSCGIQPNLK